VETKTIHSIYADLFQKMGTDV